MTRTRTFSLLLAALLLALALNTAVPAAADSSIGTLAHDGLTRTYYLHVPDDTDPDVPAPLLIALHARSSSGRAMAILTGLDDAAAAEGFITVFPDTADTAWGEDPSQEDLPDDVGFISALIDHLADEYSIDLARVYLVGYANGGSMAYKLACDIPERFAGVAVVGPLMWGYHRQACPEETAAPVSLLVMHGTEDRFYTADTHVYQPLFSEERYPILGIDDTLDFWAERSGCTLEAITGEADSASRLFEGCDDDVTVAFYDVNGAGLNWPRQGDDYRLNQFGVDAAARVLLFFSGDDGWADPPAETFEGQARTYVVYLPTSYDPAAPMPMVLTLHGRYGSGAGTAAFTGMNRIAEESGFIAVYPDGLQNPGATSPYDTGWNYFWGVPGVPLDGPDDAAFLSDLVADLSLDLTIDPARIYVSGLSNGGFMVHHLACNDPLQYAGYATVAGSAYLGMQNACQREVPIDMLIIHGTDDDNVTWEGNRQVINGREVFLTWPISDAFGYWAVHNRCDMETIETIDIPQSGLSPQTGVRVLRLDSCESGGSVVLYGIIGGGHNWPGVSRSFAGEEQPPDLNMDINAGEVIWEFFAAHGGAGETPAEE